jgi:hypothetical protein
MIGAIPIIAENRIREGMEQGEFANLLGTGRPLDLDGTYDPNWWIRRKMRREGLTADDLIESVGRQRGMK